jgi:hypothetical protein
MEGGRRFRSGIEWRRTVTALIIYIASKLRCGYSESPRQKKLTSTGDQSPAVARWGTAFSPEALGMLTIRELYSFDLGLVDDAITLSARQQKGN